MRNYGQVGTYVAGTTGLDLAERKHGARATYLAGCRCRPCAKANATWVKAYRYRASLNGGSTTKDAAPARRHIDALLTTMSMTSIERASGVSRTTIRDIRDAKIKRTKPETLRKILATRADAPVGKGYVSATGAMRRLRALHALGWPMDQLETEIGYSRFSLRKVIYGERQWITSDCNERIRVAYERLSMRLPSSEDRIVAGHITKARNRAKKLGWAPPLAWNEGEIDSPEARPHRPGDRFAVDDLVVDRILGGDWRLEATRAERLEVIARWTGAREELGRLTGWNIYRLLREEAS